jgi:catechol 2,3-dioxygenase-like lactoylglutathione lyase family enzyme
MRTLPVDGPRPMTFSHIGLRSGHYEETSAFYELLLDMEPVVRSEHGVELAVDYEHHRMALYPVPPKRRGPGPGIEHVAWKADSLAHLLGNHKRVQAAGIEHYIALHHGPTVSIYYRDPDLVQVEVFIDTQPADIGIEFLTTPQFNANPIGAPFDPNELLARYEAGEPLESLLAQPEFDEDAMDDMLDRVAASLEGE